MNSTDEILGQVNNIFKDVLDNDQVVVRQNTTADDIESWDSITNIQIIVAIEKYYKIRFTSREIQDFKNVGELCACIILKKLG